MGVNLAPPLQISALFFKKCTKVSSFSKKGARMGSFGRFFLRPGTAFGEGSLRELSSPNTFHTHTFRSPQGVTWCHKFRFGRFFGQKMRKTD